VHNGHLLAAIAYRVFERKLGDAPAARAAIDPGADRDRVRVVVNGDVVLKANVETLEILAHQHHVDVFVAPSRNQGAGWTHVGVEMKLLAQSHVRGAIATACRRGQRPF